MKNKWLTFAIIAGYVALIYFVAATIIYRFSNPSMTETELFLNIPNAIMLRW